MRFTHKNHTTELLLNIIKASCNVLSDFTVLCWATYTAAAVAHRCMRLKLQPGHTSKQLCSGFCANQLANGVSPSFLGCHPVPSHPLPRGLTRTRPSALGCRARLTPIHSSSRSPLQVFPQGSSRFFPGGKRGQRWAENGTAGCFS